MQTVKQNICIQPCKQQLLGQISIGNVVTLFSLTDTVHTLVKENLQYSLKRLIADQQLFTDSV